MFQPRTFDVPLYGGDYQQRIAKAASEVEDANERRTLAEQRAKDGKSPPRLMHETETEVDVLRADEDRLIRAHNALVAQAESDGCTKVTLKALGRKRWNALVEAHPPRTDESVAKETRDADANVGVNEETFADALLVESIVSVSDETPVAELLEHVSSAQFRDLYYTAFGLNRDGGPQPKLLTAPSLSAAETEN